jgi:hypothetical protein
MIKYCYRSRKTESKVNAHIWLRIEVSQLNFFLLKNLDILNKILNEFNDIVLIKKKRKRKKLAKQLLNLKDFLGFIKLVTNQHLAKYLA